MDTGPSNQLSTYLVGIILYTHANDDCENEHDDGQLVSKYLHVTMLL